MSTPPTYSIEERGILADLARSFEMPACRELWQPKRETEFHSTFADTVRSWQEFQESLFEQAAEMDLGEEEVDFLNQVFLKMFVADHLLDSLSEWIQRFNDMTEKYSKMLEGTKP